MIRKLIYLLHCEAAQIIGTPDWTENGGSYTHQEIEERRAQIQAKELAMSRVVDTKIDKLEPYWEPISGEIFSTVDPKMEIHSFGSAPTD